jgi:hypothetical protein
MGDKLKRLVFLLEEFILSMENNREDFLNLINGNNSLDETELYYKKGYASALRTISRQLKCFVEETRI